MKTTAWANGELTEHGTPTDRCQWLPACRRKAVNKVRIHLVDLCDDRVDADDTGDAEVRLCVYHTAVLKMDVAWEISQLRKWGRPACQTCQAPTAAIEDVVREVTPL